MSFESEKCTAAPVSVIIPCYRCAATISRAVESVAQQTVVPSEVLLIDDFSGDDTLDSLYEVQEKYWPGWIKIFKNDFNKGAASTRNVGWQHASEPFLAFLDADDAWHPKKIELQMPIFERYPGAVMVGHDILQLNGAEQQFFDNSLEDGSLKVTKVTSLPLLFSNRYSTPTVIIKRDIGVRFKECKRYSEDYLLWLKACLEYGECYKLMLPLAYSFKAFYGEGGLSGDLKAMALGQLDTYREVYRSGSITLPAFLAVTFWSRLKYYRRVLIVAFRKLRP